MRYSELYAPARRGQPGKMLTQTLRSLERDGLLTRTVTPTVPVDGHLRADGPRILAPGRHPRDQRVGGGAHGRSARRPARNMTPRLCSSRTGKRKLTESTDHAGGIHDPVTIEIRPATAFDDVKTMLGPKRSDANVCWCLSYRIPSKENRALVGPARGERVKALLERARSACSPTTVTRSWAGPPSHHEPTPASPATERSRMSMRRRVVRVVHQGATGTSQERHLATPAARSGRFARNAAPPRSRAIRWTTAARGSTSRWPTSARAASSSGSGSRRRPTPTRCSDGFPRVLMRLDLR